MKFLTLPKCKLGGIAMLAVSGCSTPSNVLPIDRSPTLPAALAVPPGNRDPSRVSNGLPEVKPASAVVSPESTPTVYTPVDAVVFALRNNPALESIRLQRGLAQGGVVIARTYPFNPVAENILQAVYGPASSGITNRTYGQSVVRLDVEVMHQRRYRQSAADAVVTRTEWEIATQEMLVSVATTRAFNTVLYRNRKMQVIEDSVKLSELVLDVVKKLVDVGRLRPADLVVAKTELDSARAVVGSGKSALSVARSDLRHQLGLLDDSFEVKGELDVPLPSPDQDLYVQTALQMRPDLQARKAAVAEAQARLRLQVADRFGNASIGPAFEVDNTNAKYIGAALYFPIPVFNLKRGEIMQAETTVARSEAEVRQTEIQSRQDVQAALLRFKAARAWVDSYANEVLPNLKTANQTMNRLLEQNDPGVDVLKVVEVQRNYLRAFDAYLDALYELSQARADLAAAVGDPALPLGLYQPQMPQAQPLPEPAKLPEAK